MKVARIHELLLKLGSIRAYPDFQNDLAARTSVTPCPSTASTLQTQWTVALHGSQA